MCNESHKEYLRQYEAAARLQMERRCTSEESDEGLGHSGSDGESNRTGSPTHPKCENLEEIENMNLDGENVELDENGKRKEDLYKCRYCDRTFCYLCHLKVHERVHTGEKPYKCTYCDVTFSQLGSLTVHMRIHTGEKPYECRICLKKFRHINSLRRHQRQVHRKTPAEVDASPRGADMIPTPGRGFPAASGAPATPYPAYPPANLANRAALKSVLEMRQMAAAHHNPAMNNLNYVRQMQLQQQYQLQAQQQQQQAAWQQQLIRSMSQHSLAQPKPAVKSTNHSIASMISDAPQTNKPKKHSFSISALVGEDSESEDDTVRIDCPEVDEEVDVISDDHISEDAHSSDPSASPCHSAGNTSDDSGAASGHSINIVVNDEDLRRALTVDPRSLSEAEKARLRQKLADIALRNISSDSGFQHDICC
jgi:hypothetical protein